MPGDRRQILSLLRLPIPPLQRNRDYQFSTRHNFAQLRNFGLPNGTKLLPPKRQMKRQQNRAI